MCHRLLSRDFWREKKQSLSSNGRNRGEASQHRIIEGEDNERQNNQEIEARTSQDENKNSSTDNPSLTRPDGEVQGARKIAAQELWKTAFNKMEQQHPDLMKKFKDLMISELKIMGHSEPTNMNAQDDWHIMEKFISRQAAIVLSPKKEKLYDGLDQAFKILEGIIEMINEPIKLIPQAAAPWAGVNIAITLISNPVKERKANLEGTQTILDKLRWYQGITGFVFQKYEEELLISMQRKLLQEKMIDYFQKLLIYQIRSILLLHTNSILVAFRGAAKLDDWDTCMKEIRNAETDLDNRIEQFEKTKEREEQNQLQKDKIRNACLNALGVDDPKSDRLRIMNDKGGLVPSCCDWIRPQEDSEKGIFLEWLDNPEQTIFWITGRAGKGKTMLMCDLIQWLEDTSQNKPLFYFFCEISKSQKTDYNAAAIRGLIFAIVSQNKQLTRHFQEMWNTNNNLFKGENVKITSHGILKAILADDFMKNATIFVDALDECGDDLDLLFEIIKSTINVKWVISSRRNTNVVDEKLLNAPRCRKVSLDDLPVVSEAVTTYIKKQIQDLSQVKGYKAEKSREIELYLTSNSEGTFLWAALACKELRDPDTDENDALEVLEKFPPGLDSMYERMMQKIQMAHEKRRKVFEIILSINLVVSRAITLDEFWRLVSSSRDFNLFNDVHHIKQMVEKCGHFFTISHFDHGDLSSQSMINFVHKSAKDYLLESGKWNVPLPGINYDIFEQCVNQMRDVLKRDMLLLKHPGSVVPKDHPGLGQLDNIAYACTSWAEHIRCSGHAHDTCTKYGTVIWDFLRKHFLHWIEALSLLGKLPVGALALYKIKSFADSHGVQTLSEFVMDAYRFLLTFQSPIEQYPLQVYASALLFSPSGSQIKTSFAEHAPNWVTVRGGLRDRWPSHLCAIDDLRPYRKGRYSADGRKLISASESDVDIRDTTTFACLQQFDILTYQHSKADTFKMSIDGTKIAWVYFEFRLIKILDTVHGTWVDISTANSVDSGLTKSVWRRNIAFSKSGDRLASYLFEGEHIDVWDTRNGSLHCRLPGSSTHDLSFCFLGDSTDLASAGGRIGEPIQIWCTETGQLKEQISLESETRVRSLEPFLNNSSKLLSVLYHGEVHIIDTVLKQSAFKFGNPSIHFTSATVSPNGEFVALCAFSRYEIEIWDLRKQTSFQLQKRHEGVGTFSSDGKLLAIQTHDSTIQVWDTGSRTVNCEFNDPSRIGRLIGFSPDSRFFAHIASFSGIKTYDISANNLELETTEKNSDAIINVLMARLSKNGKWLAVVPNDERGIELWDKTGACVCIIAKNKYVREIAFSWVGTKLAFGASDGSFGVINIAREPSTQNASPHILNLKSLRSTESLVTDATVTVLEFSPGDSLLAVVQTSSLWFFDIETGQSCKAEVPNQSRLGLCSRICAVKFHDNQIAVSIIDVADIQMWNTKNGTCVKEIRAFTNPFGFVGVSFRFAAVDIRLFEESLHIILTADVEGGRLHLINVDKEKRIRINAKISDFLEFDQDNNTIICSGYGNIDLDQFNLSLDQLASEETKVVYQGYGIRGSWIMKDDRPIIWLPPEYQREAGESCAISGSQIVIVYFSGHMLFLDFTEENMSF